MSETLVPVTGRFDQSPMTAVDWLSLKMVRRWGMESRWVDGPMGRLHVLEGQGQGSLPPVVLLHGMGARATHFRFVIRELLPHHRRVIVPDLLAHGLSEIPREFHGRDVTRSAEDILVESLDEPVVLFGTSMGGKAALEFASRHPELVGRLVVAGPAGACVQEQELADWKTRFMASSHKDALRLTHQVFGTEFSWPVRHVVAWGARRQLSTHTVKVLLDKLSTADCLEPWQLSSLQMPVLLLWGEHERMMEERHLEWFREHLPAGTRVERPAFGHSPFLEAPKVLARHIREHAR